MSKRKIPHWFYLWWQKHGTCFARPRAFEAAWKAYNLGKKDAVDIMYCNYVRRRCPHNALTMKDIYANNH